MPTKIGGFTLLFLGLFTCFDALRYGVGTFSTPGPGFFPMGVGGFLAILAVLYLREQWRKDEHSFTGGKWLKPALTIILSFAYVAILEPLGYIVSTVLMLLVFVGGIEQQKPVRTAGVALLGTAAMYVVFALLLRIPLPKGILSFGR